MKRRNFLIGASGTAIGASALIGTGAFSRVESDRHVSIEVAKDPDAYLGLSAIDTPNSDNYVDLDEKGHLEISIGENPNGGEGVNSNSTTWFDGMFEVCNQGKETAGVHIESFELPEGAVDFYRYEDDDDEPGDEVSIVGEENLVELDVGHCMLVGVRTETHAVDATGADPLFDQDVQFVADVEHEADPVAPPGAVVNLTTGETYETITEAVDDANEGDEILVGSGNYHEQVVIDRSLSLSGEEDATIKAPDEKSEFTVPESDNAFQPTVFAYGGTLDNGEVSGSKTIEVEISGLTIDGQEFDPNDTAVGVFLRNVEGSLEDTVVKNLLEGGPVTAGVEVRGDSTVDIVGNDISDFERIGIGAMGDFGDSPAPDVHLADNVVTGPGVDGEPVTGWAPNGIQIGWGATGEIVENEVTGCTHDDVYPGAIIAAGVSDVLIEGNDVSDNDDGIQVYGDFWFGSGLEATNVTVLDNVVTENVHGISVGSKSENITVIENVIEDNEIGLELWEGGGQELDTDTLEITHNDFDGNDDGTLNIAEPTATATENWWGDESGPSGEGDGDGDSVSEGVEFDPWLDAPFEAGGQPVSD